VTAPSPVAVLVATQNLNAVLRIMQWGVIALIFLFFLRVIRAVWVEMSPATIRKPRSLRRQERREERAAVRPATTQPPPRRRRQLYLKVVQPPEHVGRTYDLDDELTIGRSPGCGVSMPDDIYTSTLHARLFRRNDQLWVEDLGSTNGTFVNGQPVRRVALTDGTRVTLGRTTLVFRRDGIY
jgi:pSer/pThr/pTyr-binding forkhead associated (FHA) protein